MLIADYINNATPVQNKSSGDAVYYICPVCLTPKLEVSTCRPVWFCHRCQRGGYLHDSVSYATTRAEPALVDRLEDYSPLEDEEDPRMVYLVGRGLNREHIRTLDPHMGPDENRVYFPLRMIPGGPIVYFVGRAIGNQEIRYLLPRVSKFRYRKHELIWGMHLLRGWTSELYLCEGILDAVRKPGHLALLGHSMSPDQAEILARLNPDEFILLVEHDVPLGCSIDMAVKLNRAGYRGRVSEICLSEGMDPDLVYLRGEELPRRWRIQ